LFDFDQQKQYQLPIEFNYAHSAHFSIFTSLCFTLPTSQLWQIKFTTDALNFWLFEFNKILGSLKKSKIEGSCGKLYLAEFIMLSATVFAIFGLNTIEVLGPPPIWLPVHSLSESTPDGCQLFSISNPPFQRLFWESSHWNMMNKPHFHFNSENHSSSWEGKKIWRQMTSHQESVKLRDVFYSFKNYSVLWPKKERICEDGLPPLPPSPSWSSDIWTRKVVEL
jgi:hypothetical protein